MGVTAGGWNSQRGFPTLPLAGLPWWERRLAKEVPVGPRLCPLPEEPAGRAVAAYGLSRASSAAGKRPTKQATPQ